MALLLLSNTYPTDAPYYKNLMPWTVAPGVVVAVLTLSPWVFTHVDYSTGSAQPVPGFAIVFFGAYIMSALGLSATILFRKFFSLRGRDKELIRYAVVGVILTFSLIVIFNFIFVLAFHNTSFILLTPAFALVFSGSFAYGMIRHQLFDIRLAAIRGAAYILSLLTLAGVYYLTAVTLSEFVLKNQGSEMISQSPLSIGLALILAFIFQPVKRFFDRLTNSFFFHDDYNADDFLARLGHELSVSSDLQSLLHRASKEISDTLQAEQGFFFVRYGTNNHAIVGTSKHAHITVSDSDIFDVFASSNGPSAIVTDLLVDTDAIFALLSAQKIAITLPLFHDGKPHSYLFIGRRLSREYTQRDVRVLETIANELMIAIQNALSVQEVKDINATLQQRIEDATKELRANNKQLLHIDEVKDEFVSMASHQLRTPLTSVKGYISMVLEGDAGRITAMQRQLLEEAFTSSERMVHLISDFLNVSRLQTGKFMIDQRLVDLAKVVSQEVNSLQTTAKAHDLRLDYHEPTYFPALYLDEGKLRQVIMNFIDNAIYYSREDSAITVELSVVDGNAVMRVHDTGIGVPKAEQAHLFTKFFRASNARKQRPDGTGVGLFLAKKVIVAHGGTMVFESVEGVGSTFGFRLPIKKLSSAPADNADKLDK